jgi:hypothetical protein
MNNFLYFVLGVIAWQILRICTRSSRSNSRNVANGDSSTW